MDSSPNKKTTASAGNFMKFAIAVFLLLILPWMVPGSGRAQETQDPDKIWIILKDMDLINYIRQMSSITGKEYILDPQVQGTVNYQSRKRVNRKEAEKIFEKILREKGFKLVEGEENKVEILPIKPKMGVMDVVKPKIDDVLVDKVIQIVSEKIGCSERVVGGTEPYRIWCRIKTIRQAELSLPKTQKIFLGLMIGIPEKTLQQSSSAEQKPREDSQRANYPALYRTVDEMNSRRNQMSQLDLYNRLTTFSIGPKGARITDVVAGTENQSAQVKCLKSAIIDGFEKPDSRDLLVTSEMEVFLKGLLAHAPSPTQGSGNSATWENDHHMVSRMFEIETPNSKAYLVLERASDGILINLFSIRDWKPSATAMRNCSASAN